MKRLVKALLFLFVFTFLSSFFSSPAYAQQACSIDAPSEMQAGGQLSFTFTNNFSEALDLIAVVNPSGTHAKKIICNLHLLPGATSSTMQPDVVTKGALYTSKQVTIEIYRDQRPGATRCDQVWRTEGSPLCSRTVLVKKEVEGDSCTIQAPSILPNSNPVFSISNTSSATKNFSIEAKGLQVYEFPLSAGSTINVTGQKPLDKAGDYTIVVYENKGHDANFVSIREVACKGIIRVTTDTQQIGRVVIAAKRAFFTPDCCSTQTKQAANCESLSKLDKGIQTAIGCVPTNPETFINWLLRYTIAIGSGIAFLLMIWGAFLIITSAGDPEKLNEGKETMVSAGTGLLFIIFSVFILELIGVRILKIPGLT